MEDRGFEAAPAILDLQSSIIELSLVTQGNQRINLRRSARGQVTSKARGA